MEVAKPQAVKAAEAVKVNVEELEVRIAACILRCAELETEVAEKGAWDAAKLAPLVDRLGFVVRHNDLGLFREAAPKEQRSGITQLETPKTAISQLNARVVEAREHAKDPKSTADNVDLGPN